MSKIPVAHGSRIPLPHKHGAATKPSTSHLPVTNPKSEISSSLAATETRPSPVSLHEIENFQNVNREPLAVTTDSEISDSTSCAREVAVPHPHVGEVATQRRAHSNQRGLQSSSHDGSVKSSHSTNAHGSTTRTTDSKTAPTKSSSLASTMKKSAVNPPAAPAPVSRKAAAPAPQPQPITVRTSHQQLPSSTTTNGGTKSKTGSRSTTPTYNSKQAPAVIEAPPPEKTITSKTMKAQMSQSAHHLLTEVALQPLAPGVNGAELLRTALTMIDSTITDIPFKLSTNLSQSDAQLDAFIDEAQYKAPHEPYAYLVQLPRLTAEIQHQVQLVTAESGLDFAKLVSELNELSGRHTI